MNGFLLFYLIGVAIVFLMASKEIFTTPIERWKLKGVLRTLLYISLSWVFIAFVAIKTCWEQ